MGSAIALVQGNRIVHSRYSERLSRSKGIKKHGGQIGYRFAGAVGYL